MAAIKVTGTRSGRSFLTAPKKRGHHARVTAPMENGENPKRSLVRRVGDQIHTAHDMESQRARGQIGAAVPDVRRSGERSQSGKDIGDDTVGGVYVAVRNVFPNFSDIGERFGMESVTAHAPERRCALFSRSLRNASSPSIGFTRPLLRSS